MATIATHDHIYIAELQPLLVLPRLWLVNPSWLAATVEK
jgi:hypothetical protein